MGRAWVVVLIVAVCIGSSTARAESGRQVNVVTVNEQESYMWTMTKDTFFGGAFGILIGGAVMLLTQFEADPMVLAYATGGGMIVGAGFGVWEVVDRRDQVSGPTAAMRREGERSFAVTFRF